MHFSPLLPSKVSRGPLFTKLLIQNACEHRQAFRIDHPRLTELTGPAPKRPQTTRYQAVTPPWLIYNLKQR